MHRELPLPPVALLPVAINIHLSVQTQPIDKRSTTYVKYHRGFPLSL